MDFPTKVNVILCILSFVLAVISVITVVITLKQNHRIIRNSTRPYVTASVRITDFQDINFYIVIKNYGATGAIIKCINPSIDFLKYSYSNKFIPFSKSANTFLAPGQSIICELNHRKMADDKLSTFDINIEYQAVGEKFVYKENYPVNFEGYTQNISSRASTNGKELKIISYTLQDLVEKIM